MSIEIRSTEDPTMGRSLKVLGLIQSPSEPEAIIAAGKLKGLMTRNGLDLVAFKPYLDRQGFDYVTNRLTYLWERAECESVPTPQDLREKARVEAEKVLQNARGELEKAADLAHRADRFYRVRCTKKTTTRRDRAISRQTAQHFVKEYLEARGKLIKARNAALRAQVQCWKRNPDKCPGSGWVWVRTHQRISRNGKLYTVEGYWRAPARKRTGTADSATLIPLGTAGCEKT